MTPSIVTETSLVVAAWVLLLASFAAEHSGKLVLNAAAVVLFVGLLIRRAWRATGRRAG